MCTNGHIGVSALNKHLSQLHRETVKDLARPCLRVVVNWETLLVFSLELVRRVGAGFYCEFYGVLHVNRMLVAGCWSKS